MSRAAADQSGALSGTLFVLNSAGEGGVPSRLAAELVLAAVERGGARARAVGVRPSDLRNRGVRAALLAEGLTRLPAFRPGSGPPLLGLAAIEARLLAAPGPPPPPADDDEAAGEALEEYMRAQLSGDASDDREFLRGFPG